MKALNPEDGMLRTWSDVRVGLIGWTMSLAIGMVLIASVVENVSAAEPESESVNFDIPAQPLSKALTQFADQAEFRLLYSTDMTEGRSTSGVSGRHLPEDALQQLLSGTGLTYRKTEPGTITLEPGGAGGVVPTIPPPAPSSGSGSKERPVKVEEVVVKDVNQRETQELDNLPPEYAGGDVARGGRVGILGNRDIMDTPLTQMNYTSKLIQDQQARFLTDVLRNDPSVQINQGVSSGFMVFNIRGFFIRAGDNSFNGFLGIGPGFNGTMMTESIERVEVLRGPSALLNGAAPG
ncbi:MAG: TonB-dependent receptor plug domain-containing protein, partial [Verrucomicrobiae bacterium]|nr:TonB-dependent receptor plug domain-containing protein [Verrucomicrobiae bacterium]